MLYTSYISKLKNLPEDVTKILITRIVPKSLDITKYKNLYIDKRFAPSKKLLLDYKNNQDWNKYVLAFNKEIENRKDLKEALEELLTFLKEKQKDIILICYEKDHEHCHRDLIGRWIKQHNIEYREF